MVSSQRNMIRPYCAICPEMEVNVSHVPLTTVHVNIKLQDLFSVILMDQLFIRKIGS